MDRRKLIFFVLCYLGMVTYFTERWVFGPMIPYLMSDFGIDRIRAGILGSAQMFGVLLTLFLAGFLSDRLNRKYVTLAGFFGLSLLTLLSGFASSYPELYAARFLTGMSEPFFSLTLMVLIVELFPKQPGFFVTLLLSGTSVGWFVGPLLSGWLLQISENWRYPFWISGSVGLLVFFGLVLCWSGNGTRKEILQRGAKRRFPFKSSLVIVLITLSVAAFFNTIAEIGFSLWLPTFLKEEKGFSIFQAGVITSMWGLGQAIGRPILGFLSDRVGYRRIGILAAWGVALSFYCIVISETQVSFVFWQWMAGFIGAAVMGSVWTFVALLFGRYKGTALGFNGNIAFLGGATSPILCGYIGEHVSLAKGLLLISVIPSVIIGFLFLISYVWVREDRPGDLQACFVGASS